MFWICPLATIYLYWNNWNYLKYDLIILNFYTVSYTAADTEHKGNPKEPGSFPGMFIRPGMPLHK